MLLIVGAGWTLRSFLGSHKRFRTFAAAHEAPACPTCLGGRQRVGFGGRWINLGVVSVLSRVPICLY
jgi:hypothetical protein